MRTKEYIAAGDAFQVVLSQRFERQTKADPFDIYRALRVAPKSGLPPERQGKVVGRFCLTCSNVYPLYAPAHKGKPFYGKDHVASTCTHEGEEFSEGVAWWEPAVEVIEEEQEN